MEYTDEYIRMLFETSKTQTEIIKKLGRRVNGSGRRLVSKLADQIGVDLKEFGQRMTKDAYLNAPKRCKCCGKELTYKQRNNDYCSHSCAAKINNIGVVRNGEKYEFGTHKCLNCGKVLEQKQRHNKFCSSECSFEFRANELITRWINGENFTRGGCQVPRFIKRYLMQLHNNKCEKCGWGEEHPITHTIPLEIHHIDGDCTNNKKDNLQLLCPNCHCLTENFGNLNKNSRRFHRKRITISETTDNKKNPNVVGSSPTSRPNRRMKETLGL